MNYELSDEQIDELGAECKLIREGDCHNGRSPDELNELLLNIKSAILSRVLMQMDFSLLDQARRDQELMLVSFWMGRAWEKLFGELKPETFRGLGIDDFKDAGIMK